MNPREALEQISYLALEGFDLGREKHTAESFYLSGILQIARTALEEAPAPTSPTTRELLVLEERIRRLEERHGLRLSTPPPNKPSKQGVPPPEDPR